MPRSRQARMTRSAISPRLATSMRWNIAKHSACGIDPEQHGAVIDEVLVRRHHLGNDPAAPRLDLVLHLHGQDDAHGRGRAHPAPHGNKGRSAWLFLRVEGADDLALDLQEL